MRELSVKCEASVHTWVAVWDSGGNKNGRTETDIGRFEHDFRGEGTKKFEQDSMN